MTRVILLLFCIQIGVTFSQQTTPAPRGSKHATSNKSFFDIPASNRLLPNELNTAGHSGRMDFSSSEIDDIVGQHNKHRGNTEPLAADMRHMVWDGTLATMAQDWADTCVYQHGGFEPNLSPYSHVGQNIYIAEDAPGMDSAVHATDLWHGEVEFYSYNSNSCRPDEICGHYTQVVWAESTSVGCGRKFCPNVWVHGQQWHNAHYIVCNYGPAGNFRGKLPYIRGERCASCPNDASFCTPEGLCRDCSQEDGNAVDQCGKCTRQCQNCGTLDRVSCTCQCAPGWDGPDCSEPCADHHEWCGADYGWPTAEFCDLEPYSTYARQHCNAMCGLCEPFDPDFQCNPSESLPTVPAVPTVKNTKYCKTTFTSVAVIDQQLYAMKKEKMWRFDGVRNGRILSSTSGDDTTSHFKKINPDFRAVYQREFDGKVLFFRGKNYWQYSKDDVSGQWLREDGFPRPIAGAGNFPGLPTSVSAAVHDRFIRKTYFIKGAYIWRYDEIQQSFDVEKERITNVFEGLPSKLSGAFQDVNGDLIFVKGRDYWRVRRGESRVAFPEPENLALAFMDCYE